MRYRGTEVDRLIAAGHGRLAVRDGGALCPRGLILPQRLSDVKLNAAAHLSLPPDDPSVMNEVHRHYLPVSGHHVLARNLARPPGLVTHSARDHPRGLRYQAGAATRALAHLAERPHAVAAGFSAAALLGVGDLADAADSALLGPFNRTIAGTPTVPTVRRRPPGLPTWTLLLDDRPLTLTPPMLTLAHCLRAVLAEEHAWRVPSGLPHSATTIRAVQLIDRFRREFALGPEHLAAALHGLINHRTLDRLLRLSDGGADSPPETSLRLMVRFLAPHLTWQSQVPIHNDDGTLLTVLDLAALTRRIYLYYDGEHHLSRGQRDKDALITARLHAAGWVGLRVTAGMVEGVHLLRGLLGALTQPGSWAA